MKILGRELPSLGEYLASKNEKEQAQAELILMLFPFLLGYAVFLYQWIILWSPIEDSVAAPSVIMAFGYIFYFKWRDNIRAEAQALDATVLNLRWDEEIKDVFKGVVESKKALLETEAAPTKLNGTFKVKKEIVIGKFYQKLSFVNWIINPLDGRKTKTCAVIMDFPYDKTFRKTAGHWFSHKGQLFPINAGDVDATYVGFNDDTELVFFFRVTSDQERTRLMQVGLGLQPATADIDEVNKARQLVSTRTAIEHLIRANRAEGHLQVLNDNYPDVEKDAFKGASRLIRDMDALREKIKGETWRDRLSLRNMIIIALLLVAAYWAYTQWFAEPETVTTALTMVIRRVRHR